MSAKNSHTTASYIPWDSAINVVHRLHKDKKYRMSLFISTGIFTGLRVRDLRALRWNDLMGEDTIAIIEHKTKKRREIKLNHDFQQHVRDCYNALGIKNPNEYCFLSQKGTVYSTQRLNILLKDIRDKYKLPVKIISCHSLRKSFSRRIYDMAGDNKEEVLIYLGEVLSHSSTQITRRYIGLKQEHILQAYDLLTF